MRSDKSRGLYEALQRSRKGMKRAPDGQAGDQHKAPLQQALPFKPHDAAALPTQQQSPPEEQRKVAPHDDPALPLLSRDGPKKDDTGIHGRDERPEEQAPTPPSTVRAPQQGQPADAAETRSPVIPAAGGGPGGISFGGGRTAPRTDMAGFRSWRPLILTLLAVVLGLFVLALLIVGLVSMFDAGENDQGSSIQPGAETVEDAANQTPQGAVLENSGPNQLERSLINYDDSVPPGEHIGQVVDASGRQHLIPDLSGPYRIVIVSTTRSNLERVQDFMLRQDIPTRIVGGSLMTEQTFPSASDGAAAEYLRRVKALDVEYSRETRGQTSFQTAYFIRQ